MLMFDDLQRPYISVPEPIRDQSWLDSVELSQLEHRWNHYHNQLTLATLLPWLEDQENAPIGNQTQIKISPSPEAAIQQWQWVTGTALTLGDRRLIVVPMDSWDASEFKVPQEWVEIPAWRGDYYLMVQLNSELGQLQLRGYINHRQLKQGTYDASDRTYRVSEEALVQDIDLLWVMAELEPVTERQAKLAPIPRLPQHQASSLIQQLSRQLQAPLVSEPQASSPQPSAPPLAPRLALPFQSWASILSDPQSLNLLHESIPRSTIAPPLSTQLSQWFQGNFDAAWQSLDQLSSSQRTWGLRSMPAQSISRGKRVALSGIHPVLSLWTTVTAEIDGRMKVLVQLRHKSDSPDGLVVQPLPRGVELSLVTPGRESLQVVTAQERDDYIQLKRFKVLSGQAFSVEVRLGTQTVREQFRA